MSKAAFDAKIAAIDALKSPDAEASREGALTKALRDRSNVIVAKAARVAGEVGVRALVPELLAAFDRMMTNAVKSDPQCLAKLAIVKALAVLRYDVPDVYLRGMRHIQMEPVWGGQEDTAGVLRSQAAWFMLDCPCVHDVDALEYLIELLVDNDKNVRTEAARAIGRIDRRESALVLRVRALTGDDAEPLGAVFAALLAIEGTKGIEFVARFLRADDEAAQEAALALGGVHEKQAFEALRDALQTASDRDLRSTLMVSIALTRLPEAIEFLVSQMEAGSHDAKQALQRVPVPESLRDRVEKAGA